jgi:TRAP transporter TAXI family solute receptor
MLTRRALLKALPLPLLAPVSGCLGDAWRELPETEVVIATGNPGGVFHRYGEALRTVLDQQLPDLTATTRATNASVRNVRLVAAGEADLGFSLGDTAADAVRGTGTFDRPLEVTALARTYDSFVQLVVRGASGIVDADDLRGRRVSIGAPGSGTRVLAQRVLEQAGLNAADLDTASTPLEESAQGLRDGTLDAFFFVSGIPNRAILDLSRTTAIRLVELDRLVPRMVAAYGPEYGAGPVPTSTYSLPNGVDTVSVKNYVVADPRMSEDLAYAVTRLMFEAQDAIDAAAPGVRQPTLGAAIFTSPVELHPGSVRYFRERQA